MDLLNKVKERLDITDKNQDKKIQGYIDDITDKIKSICNRIDLPEELEYLVVRYSMNCTVFYKNGYGEGKQVVASASDNGQTVSFKDVGAVNSDDVDIDKYLKKNKDEISMYAYVRW
ncbi:MAG: phage head-tail connector protein [Clostridia bacterium]|nr:phage head-tail connector protein [Clostridia bacterium]MCI9063884.1 phage head-tail connector protein [Clostridia bacterium]